MILIWVLHRIRWLQSEQAKQVLIGESAEDLIVLHLPEYVLKELSLPAQDFSNAFLDGVAGIQGVDEYRTLLSNPMHPRRPLIHYRGIPPMVEMKHVAGTGEGDSHTTGADSHQQNVALILLLQLLDYPLPLVLTSTVSIWFCRVDMLELTASIFGGKPPVYG